MKSSTNAFGAPEILVVVGCCVFVFILWLSAYFDASIRWLHFFQSWMYLATIVLSLRRNRCGYFIGLSVAGFWDYINLFVTTFFLGGLHWLRVSIADGRLQNVDQIIAVPAWIGNFLVMFGCLWAYGRLAGKSVTDLGRFIFAFLLATGSLPQQLLSSNHAICLSFKLCFTYVFLR